MTDSPPFFRRLSALLVCMALMGILSPLAATIWWTGKGDSNNWSDVDNWFDGTEARLPVPGDEVRLGYAGTAEHPVDNDPFSIVLDESVTIGRLFLDNVGDRSVSLTSVNGQTITLNGSNSRVVMSSTAASNAFIDVTIGPGSDYTNSSSTALIEFGPNSSVNVGQTFGGGGYRLGGAMSGTLRTRAEQNFFIDGVNHSGTFRIDSLAHYKMEGDGFFNNIQVFNTSNVNWGTIERIGEGDRTLTVNNFSVQTASSQAARNWSNSTFTVISNPEDEGHLTFRVNRWSTPSGGGPGLSPHIVTDAHTTVELFGAAGVMTPGVIGSERITGITGPGNVHLRMDTPTSVFNLQRMTDYTGRTILERGILSIGAMTITAAHASSNFEVDPTTPGTYYGSLPLGTLVEIGEDATLRLNAGFGQTVGGITGYDGTAGTVDLNGAELTINAGDDSSFGGVFSGVGSIIKEGAGTFTVEGAYTNPTGRTLAINNGIFAVDGALDVTEGTFQLGGGRITAASLIATEITWNVILAATAADAHMVAVTSADITDSLLSLALADDYVPGIGTQFTLLYAADSITGASEFDMFGFADGDTFLLDGIEFSINWVTGSESIVLTVVPEPGHFAAVFAMVAALIVLRRRHKRVL